MARTFTSGIPLAVASLALLAACGSVPKAAPGYASHDFGPFDKGVVRAAVLPIRHVEVVSAPWLASTAMQYRLLYAQPTRRQSFLENRWAAPPAQLVELAARRAIRADSAGMPAGACRLRIELDEFAQLFDSEASSRGVVEARVALLAPRGDQLIALRSFSVSWPAPSPNAVGGVVALREGVGAMSREVLDWLEALAAQAGSGLAARCGA